jgi:hypothetical protein
MTEMSCAVSIMVQGNSTHLRSVDWLQPDLCLFLHLFDDATSTLVVIQRRMKMILWLLTVI